MQSQGIINVDELLTPIAGDSRAGADLRRDFNSEFHKLKEVREAARRAEKTEDMPPDQDEQAGKPGETEKMQNSGGYWREIFDHSQNVIRHESKDLQVAVWLLEALVRLHKFHAEHCKHSFAGLRDGFRLLRGLVENFWDELYPHEDENGLKTKLRPITVLNGEDREGILIEPIRKVPITAGETPFSTGDYLWAITTKVENAGTYVSVYEYLEKSARQTPAEFFWSLMSDVQDCQIELESLAQLLREKAGSANVYTSRLSQVLANVQDAIRHVCQKIAGKELGPHTSEAEPGEEQEWNQNTSPANEKTQEASRKVAVGIGPIQDRDDAFNRLLEIAKFFEDKEPHSPISYTLKEVVRRGRLTLIDLLGELIDDKSRTRFLERAAYVLPNRTMRSQKKVASRPSAMQRGGAIPEEERRTMTDIYRKLERVRPTGVHITFDIHTGEHEPKNDLPFVVGVMGNFSGDTTDNTPLDKRKFVEIDRDTFDTVMASMSPGLEKLEVENTLAGDGTTIHLDEPLKFNSMRDFEPGSIIERVPALRNLMLIRNRLRDLMSKADRSPALRALLEQVLQNKDGALEALARELGVGSAPGALSAKEDM